MRQPPLHGALNGAGNTLKLYNLPRFPPFHFNLSHWLCMRIQPFLNFQPPYKNRL